MLKQILNLLHEYSVFILISLIIAFSAYIILMISEPDILNKLYISTLTNNYSSIQNKQIEESSTVLGIENNQNNFSFKVSSKDFRAVVFEEFLRRNNSPLQGHGEYFVTACQTYQAPEDCTVVVAIAKVETDLCNYLPSQDQKNCWGFGGAGVNRYLFDSYRSGINLVTSRLALSYGNYFMVNPNAMEMTYCGPRPSCGIWGDNVQSVMNDLNSLSIEMGFVPLFSLRTRDYSKW